ncbi:MAG: methylated-DNA--[protein]-cysteine S-methyltransferase [Ginsengibacter sp.]
MQNNTGYYHSPIGKIQVNSSDGKITGVVFILSGPESESTVGDAKENFEPVVRTCLQQLDEYFSGKRKIFDLPLSHTGTDFQKQVWNGLIQIPYGSTSSYLQLSKNLGNSKATRAVGAANGKNKISIIVPCHRVIGSNGNMVGYGGEVWRKKWLLEHESKYAHGVQKLF